MKERFTKLALLFGQVWTVIEQVIFNLAELFNIKTVFTKDIKPFLRPFNFFLQGFSEANSLFKSSAGHHFVVCLKSYLLKAKHLENSSHVFASNNFINIQKWAESEKIFS